MTKTAIVVLSDTKSGSEEALGRLFNAMFVATNDVMSTGLSRIREKEIPGTSGIIDLSRYLDENHRLLIF